MSPRARGHHVRKVCPCGWRAWPKCEHAWYFSYKPKGGPRYRFSLDAEGGPRIDSKTDAENAAATIRSAIHAGPFERVADRRAREQREDRDRAAQPAAASSAVTLDQLTTTYITRAVKPSGKASWKDDEYLLATVCNHRPLDGRRLGDWALTAITEDELEVFLSAQRAAGRAASTLNHFVQVLKAAFRWAARKAYLHRSPISDDSALKRSKIAKRTRRVSAAEESALLAVVSPRLHRLIVAALETGMRLGELRGLVWRDVDLDGRVLTVRAETAKDDDARPIPISSRLAGFLEIARTCPDGNDFPPDAFVFGELDKPLGSIKKAWETAVLKAHGVKPVWIDSKLSAECRAQLRRIDLRFHDLRREAGSRWLETGFFQLHDIRDLLGHANVSQTDTYLATKIGGLQASMKRLDAARGKTVAKEAGIEQRPLGHDEQGEAQKEQLH